MNTQDQNRSSELAAEALNSLIKALEAGNSEALTSYLGVMARFHQYSWNSYLFIALQRPASTQVAGFHAWHKFEGFVRKDKKGIAILARVLVKREAEDEKNQDASTKISQQLVGFRTAFAFDVVQTEGEALSEFAKVTGDPAGQVHMLKNIAQSRGIELRYDNAVAPAKSVSYSGRISLLSGMSAAEILKALEIVEQRAA